LLADLAPVNAGIMDGYGALLSDFATVDGAHSTFDSDLGDLRYDRMAADVAAIEAATDRVAGDLVTIQRLAQDGLLILDRYAPEPCLADMWAVERTAMLLWGDTIDAVATNPGEIRSRVQLADYLLGTYTDLIESITDCSGPPEAAA
jgi:hypothetical protein